jgi:hypothetical protein
VREHDRLVKLGRRYALRECPVVISEIAGGREEPDVIGFKHGGESLVIECKASRSDYLAEKKKSIRRELPPRFAPLAHSNSAGMGSRRYYLTPENLVTVDELPQGWGLLELMKNKRTIGLRCGSALFEKDAHAEINLLISTLRRMRGYRIDNVSIRVYQFQTKNRAALIFKPEED